MFWTIDYWTGLITKSLEERQAANSWKENVILALKLGGFFFFWLKFENQWQDEGTQMWEDSPIEKKVSGVNQMK